MSLLRWALAAGLLGSVGCATIAGLDGDYDVGVGGTGGTISAGGRAPDGGSAGAPTGHGGSAGGGAAVEDCLDGIDNDDNGLIDCADPSCQPAYECVPLPNVPTDWEGYFTVDTEAYPAAAVSPCVDNASPAVLFSGPGAAAQCSACSCATATGTCSFPTLGDYWDTSSCSGSPDATYAPGDGDCHRFPTNCGAVCSNDQRAMIETASALVGKATCAPSGGAPTLPPLWSNEHHVCELPVTGGGGCEAGMACVSSGQSFGGACVRRAGAHGCPSGWTNAIDAFANASDDRGCSACGCNAAGVSCTGGSYIISDDNDCAGGTNPDITVTGSACVSTRDHLDESAGSYRAQAGSVTGGCAPTGGQPTGSVTPSDPVTYCCL